MTNPIRDTVYTVTVPVDLSAAVLAACRAEAAAGIKRTPTPMMRVLPPLTAAAACAAVLGVALYLGGNTPDDLPVLPPVGNESTTTEATAPTDSTAKPTTTTTVKPTTTKEWPIIVADEPEYFGDRGEEGFSFDKLSPALKEKMELYKGENVKFSVIVETLHSSEEYHKLWNDSKEELEKLAQYEKEQEKIADEFEEEAKRLDPNYDGSYVEVWSAKLFEISDRLTAAHSKLESAKDGLRSFCEKGSLEKNVEKLKEIVKTELIPLTTDDRFYPISNHRPEYAFFMVLTADEIHALIERDAYLIRLKYPDGDKEIDLPE